MSKEMKKVTTFGIAIACISLIALIVWTLVMTADASSEVVLLSKRSTPIVTHQDKPSIELPGVIELPGYAIYRSNRVADNMLEVYNDSDINLTEERLLELLSDGRDSYIVPFELSSWYRVNNSYIKIGLHNTNTVFFYDIQTDTLKLTTEDNDNVPHILYVNDFPESVAVQSGIHTALMKSEIDFNKDTDWVVVDWEANSNEFIVSWCAGTYEETLTLPKELTGIVVADDDVGYWQSKLPVKYADKLSVSGIFTAMHSITQDDEWPALLIDTFSVDGSTCVLSDSTSTFQLEYNMASGTYTTSNSMAVSPYIYFFYDVPVEESLLQKITDAVGNDTNTWIYCNYSKDRDTFELWSYRGVFYKKIPV